MFLEGTKFQNSIHKSEIRLKYKCNEFQKSVEKFYRFQILVKEISKISNGFQNPRSTPLD